jgi:hypothetical protein
MCTRNTAQCSPVRDHHLGAKDIQHDSTWQSSVADGLCQVLLCLQVHILWYTAQIRQQERSDAMYGCQWWIEADEYDTSPSHP